MNVGRFLLLFFFSSLTNAQDFTSGVTPPSRNWIDQTSNAQRSTSNVQLGGGIHRVPLVAPPKVEPLLAETEALIKIFAASIRTAEKNRQ